MTRFAAIANTPFYRCSLVRDSVDSLRPDYVLLLGGFVKCWRVIEGWRVLGINALEDDILASKLLRRAGGYVAGRWTEPVKGVFVGGVDGANPIQNLGRLMNAFPARHGVYIVLSRYPPCRSSCSLHSGLDIEFCIEELDELLDKCARFGIAIFAVGSYLHRACSDSLERGSVFVVDSSPKRILLIDVERGIVDARLVE